MSRFSKCKALCAAVILGLALPSIAIGASADLTWAEPTQNEDGTPLTDLASYDIWYGCSQPGVYTNVETLAAPATTYTVIGLPSTGTCYFAAKAVNSSGQSSVFSNEAARVFGALSVPGAVTDTTITWQQSPVVAFSFIQDDSTNATGKSVAYTSSVTSGSLLVLVFRVATSDADPVTGVSDGVNGSWTRAVYSGKDSDNNHGYIYYFAGAASGATTVSVGVGAISSANVRMGIVEYSAPSSTILVGSNNSSQQSSTTDCNSGTASTTSTDAMAFGGAITGGGATFTAGGTGQTWVKRDADNAQRVGMQDDVSASSGSSESVMTIGGNDFTTGMIVFFGIAEGGAAALIETPLIHSFAVNRAANY